MIRSAVRSAGLALLLTVSGCGSFVSSGTGTRTPGLSVAQAALEGGAAQIALQVSEGVLHDSPNNIHALEIKGDALTLLGDYDQAGAIFQALLSKDPNSVRAGIGMGRVKLAKDPAEAEVLFQRVLRHDPRNVTALNNLGIARDLQGHHPQAQGAYREALALNPDLESAQVNLALSMAMSGQGPAAVKLLQSRADQPGAPSKVKHDYAVVLAMAGHRAEAERVLDEDMPPNEAHQLLDSATGTHTPLPVRRSAIASEAQDDDVPPDVVQVPEPGAAPPAARKLASGPAQRNGRGGATDVAVALPAPPPPKVVRPREAGEPQSDTPMVQPTNPIAAAVTNQQSLALPMRATPSNPAPVRPVSDVAPAAAIVKPEVVKVPLLSPAQRRAATTAQSTPAALPVPPPAPLPPLPADVHIEWPAAAVTGASAAADATARIEAARTSARVAAQPRIPVRPAAAVAAASSAPAPTLVASAAAVPAHAVVAERKSNDRSVRREAAFEAPQHNSSSEAGLTVQFAATPSEESAHSFWQSLVHRFPDALGQREPLVIRFEHDGAVFWRVRTEGFASLSEAQSLCARMRAEGQACFVPRS